MFRLTGMLDGIIGSAVGPHQLGFASLRLLRLTGAVLPAAFACTFRAVRLSRRSGSAAAFQRCFHGWRLLDLIQGCSLGQAVAAMASFTSRLLARVCLEWATVDRYVGMWSVMTNRVF